MSAEEKETGGHYGPTDAELSDMPWKYSGYKDFTDYVASDPDFFAVRRFHRLHTRAILTLQDHLAAKEEELEAMDIEYSSRHVKVVGKYPPEVIRVPPSGLIAEEERACLFAKHGNYAEPRDIDNGTLRKDMPKRAALVVDITQKLENYDTLVLNYLQLCARNKASRWNIQNIKNWFINNPGTIIEKEQRFIEQTDELISFSTDNMKSPIRRLFERRLVYPTGKIIGLFKKEARYMSIRDRDNVYLYDDDTIEKFAFVVMLATTVTMLIAPLWILQSLADTHWKLGVITVFTLVWQGILLCGTPGRLFEKLAATAGYLAVLVVFLQFGSSGSSGFS